MTRRPTPEERAREIYEERTREHQRIHGSFSAEAMAELTKDRDR